MATKTRLTKDEYNECAETAAAVTGYDPANSAIRGAKTLQILQTTITDIRNGNTAIALETLELLQKREAFNAIRGDQVKSRIRAKEQAAAGQN
jgi:hypothetical protein